MASSIFRLHVPLFIRIIYIRRTQKAADSSFVESVARRWRNSEEGGRWENVVDPQQLLDSFHSWLLTHSDALPRHDHVMAFVG